MSDSAQQDITWMRYALALAQQAEQQGEVPVGAVIVKDNHILASGFNCPIKNCDPTAHAEIQALRAGALQENNYRLNQSTLYVTLEPCAMCAGAMIQARIARVVFGARDPNGGACGSVFNILQNDSLNHRAQVSEGVLAMECAQILRSFFQKKRKMSISAVINKD